VPTPGDERRRLRRARIHRATSALLQHTALRLLIPFLVPLAILISAALTWFWQGFGPLGYFGIGIVGIALTGVYLVKVEGAHMGWLVPLIAFFLPTLFFFAAIPDAILAHSGQPIAAVVEYNSTQDSSGTWYCDAEMPNSSGVPPALVPGEPTSGISDCHKRQGDHVALIVDMRGQIAPILASERNQWAGDAAVGGGALLLLCLSITGAIINGERWVRRNQRRLPVGWAERLLRHRGSAAHLWLH
jgi:hypothetical protein